MKTLILAPLLFVLTIPGHAAPMPAKKWYLAVDIYTHDNRGGINNPEKTYLEHAFDSRNRCLARARTFRKQCGGLVVSNRKDGEGFEKFIAYCQRHPRQPEPVLKIWTDDEEEEKTCAK